LFARIKGNGEIRLINCIFKGNQAFNGAGIFAENKEAGSVVLINNTFSGNEASNVAGGANFVFEKATSACQIYNNIFWNNLAVLQPGLLIRNDTGASVNLFNNDMEDYKVSATAALTKAYNIKQDPLLTADLDLQEGSPCIDTGANNAPFLPGTDIGGNLRMVDGDGNGSVIADMGAYEVSRVYPSGGTFGTRILLVGPGYGSKKGKVLVGNSVSKILEWTDESVRCEITKSLLPGGMT